MTALHLAGVHGSQCTSFRSSKLCCRVRSLAATFLTTTPRSDEIEWSLIALKMRMKQLHIPHFELISQPSWCRNERSFFVASEKPYNCFLYFSVSRGSNSNHRIVSISVWKCTPLSERTLPKPRNKAHILLNRHQEEKMSPKTIPI